MENLLGTGTLITDLNEIQGITGDSQDNRIGLQGIMLYAGRYFIDVCDDGTYQLHIDNDIYNDVVLSKLEKILNVWVHAERKGI